MNPHHQKELLEICRDKSSGSAEIARKTLEVLGKIHFHGNIDDFKEAAQTLIKGQSSMAAAINMVSRFCLEVKTSPSPGLKEKASIIAAKLGEYFEEGILDTVEKTSAEAAKYQLISTYSRSSIVEKALLLRASYSSEFKVLISEGRPGLEGVTLAENLAKAGIDVTLCVDAALPSQLTEHHALFIGADAITKHRFCNKIGTRIMCQAARELKIPVMVAASPDKLLAPGLQRFFAISDQDHDDIYSTNKQKITVFNQLFEWVDNSLVDSFIIGEKILRPEKIESIMQDTRISCLLTNG